MSQKRPGVLLKFEDGSKVALLGKTCTNVAHIDGDEGAVEIYRQDGYQVFETGNGSQGSNQGEWNPQMVANTANVGTTASGQGGQQGQQDSENNSGDVREDLGIAKGITATSIPGAMGTTQQSPRGGSGTNAV